MTAHETAAQRAAALLQECEGASPPSLRGEARPAGDAGA